MSTVLSDHLVIVSCADSGELHVLHLDATTGTLRPRQVVAPGGQLMPMALSPDRRHLWVARRSEPLAVIAYAVDAARTRLEPLGETALPASMAGLATDHSGRWLFSASYGADLVALQPIRPDGRIDACTAIHPTGRHAHAVAISSDNRQVLASALGADRLHHWHFDATSGRLDPAEPPVVPMPAGTGPRHLRFNTRGDRLYVLGELDAVLHVLAIDPAGRTPPALLQSVPTCPPGFEGTPWAADLHLTPDGRHLYSCERYSHTIAGFAVDGDSGRVTALEPIHHWPTQSQPRGFAISSDGAWLVAAGQTSHRVGLHRIDAASGDLNRGNEVEVGRNPNWVELLPL